STLKRSPVIDQVFTLTRCQAIFFAVLHGSLRTCLCTIRTEKTPAQVELEPSIVDRYRIRGTRHCARPAFVRTPIRIHNRQPPISIRQSWRLSRVINRSMTLLQSTEHDLQHARFSLITSHAHNTTD